MQFLSFDFFLSQSTEVTPSSVLPDEITKELEALSVVDDERKLRIKHLEKLRRREDVVPGKFLFSS